MNRFHRVAAVGVVALAVSIGSKPTFAQLVVFDPNNYAQNVLTAARALQQINNQITSLQNQAQMLVNQAKNLASLPYSSLQQLEQSIQRTQQLLAQAQRISFDIQQIDHAFSTTYASSSSNVTDQALIASAHARWQNSVAGFQDAMRVQATVVGNIDTNRAQMSTLVSASQGATGALQASQAGNQLLALQAQQLADLTATVAAQSRAQNLESAQRTAAQDQGREQLRRFLTQSRGYQATPVQMFHQ
jgi:type IV secretion system protein TrbJ